MGQTRLYAIIWFLIFTGLYTWFDSMSWSILSILALIMAALSGGTFIRTFF